MGNASVTGSFIPESGAPLRGKGPSTHVEEFVNEHLTKKNSSPAKKNSSSSIRRRRNIKFKFIFFLRNSIFH